MIRRLFPCLVLSALFHLGLFSGALWIVHWEATHAGAVLIDLTASTLPRANNPVRPAPLPPAELWVLASGRHLAPPPKPAPRNPTVVAQAEPLAEAPAPPCPAPCPERPGDWVSLRNLSRLPMWTSGMITENDYPQDMRREQKDGIVVVDVLIDTEGVVRGVSLVQGSSPEFDALVLQRLSGSRFEPAYDKNGLKVACRARIPVQFSLKAQ
ncbi:MAG TPA: energy transducer TonB [bacterium]|nr:energy transducer TonB [bacterium]